MVTVTMPMKYCIKDGYKCNINPSCHSDLVDYGKVWQPEVYNLAYQTAVKNNAEYIIDIGNGNGEKLKRFETQFKLIAIDFGNNQEKISKNVSLSRFIAVNFDKDIPQLEEDIISNSVIIFSDCLEHIVEPDSALKWLANLSGKCIEMFISTPDRDKVRGKDDMGPPKDICHVREWNFSEFKQLLTEYKFYNLRMGHTINNNIDKNRWIILASCGKIDYQIMNPLVSINVPLYNKENYIKECLNSIIKQEYTNIEVIIVDDGSTDRSFDIANKLIESYSGKIKFTIIRHMENKGVSGARNTGIKNSNGEYVYFLDADDEITTNCIFTLVEEARKYIDIDMVQGNAYQIPRVPQEQDPYDIINFKFPNFVSNKEFIQEYYFDPSKFNILCNKLIRRNFIVDNNLYFKEGIVHEDELWLFFAVKFLESMAFTEKYCYIRKIIPDSIMTNFDKYPSILSCLIIAEEMMNNFDIDVPDKKMLFIQRMLLVNKNRINSDERYRGLLSKCDSLLKRLDVYFYSSRKATLKYEASKMKQKLKRYLISVNNNFPILGKIVTASLRK